MEDLIELATYQDDDYGLIVQFSDNDGNCSFYSLEIDDNGEKIYNKLDSEINRTLEEKYFDNENE